MTIKAMKDLKTRDPAPEAPQVTLGKQYLVSRQGGQSRIATVLNTRTTKSGQAEVYISVLGTDKRLDNWIAQAELGSEVVNTTSAANSGQAGPSRVANALKRKLTETLDVNGYDGTPEPTLSEASTPEREHANATRVRNFEDVRFGEYLINTWYYSPYPMTAEEAKNGSSNTLDRPGPSNHLLSNGSNAKPVLSRSASKKGKAPMNGDTNSQDARSRAARTATEVFALGVGRGGEGARPRLWACDLCFKYMKTRDGWERHTSSCEMLQPPGRKVYQRGSYTIWEVDGAVAPLYCQNLSLFGKLFIDHKSVFYHVEGFLFYVLCDAATSRRDQVMAFFSKEKQSYDDFNLACIITFPPFQNNGFGKLLIEFSYILTKHPSTRSITGSPGTPERPLSDLGLKGYMAYWAAVVLRFCRALVESAPPLDIPPPTTPKTPSKTKTPASERALRDRRQSQISNGFKDPEKPSINVNGQNFRKIKETSHAGQYGISVTLAEIAQACHIRIDDAAFTLAELGFLQHRREPRAGLTKARRKRRTAPDDGDADGEAAEGEDTERDLGEWKTVEVVISREMVDAAWKKWRVKDKGVLDEAYVLL